MNKCVLKKTFNNIWKEIKDPIERFLAVIIVFGYVFFTIKFPILGLTIVILFILYSIFKLIKDSYKKAVDQCK